MTRFDKTFGALRSRAVLMTSDLKILPGLYLAIALPAVLLMSLMTQPLHAVDEPAHFMRALQIADGGILPVLGPDAASTGSYHPAGVRDFVSYYGTDLRVFNRTDAPASFGELRRLYGIEAQGHPVYIEHSNTTIYFPLPYAGSSAGIALARMFTDRPLVWLYAARLCSALLAIVLTVLAIATATRARLLLFFLALMPVTLFQTANLSADTLLLPGAMLAAALVGRVLDREVLRPSTIGLAIVASALIGLGKLAYLPFVSVLPAAALVSARRIDRTAIILSGIVAGIVAIGIAWDLQIHDLVFTAIQGPVRASVDIGKQMALVRDRPMLFVDALGHTLTASRLWWYAISLSGALIGWLDVKFPGPVIVVDLALLCALIVFDRKRSKAPAILGIYAALLVAGCTLGILLLLYAQWNPVGATTIDGFQGRYVLPMIPLLAASLPRLAMPRRLRPAVPVAVVAWCWLLTSLTLILDMRRYWGWS